MDSTDPSHWDLLDDLLAAATASLLPAMNHWRIATMPHLRFSTAAFSVAPTTSHFGRQRWSQDALTDPHCLHRAVSLDSSVPCISPMAPDIAQQCVESLIIRGLAATFPSDYTFQARRQRFGRYSALVARDSGWAYDPHSFRAMTPGEHRLNSHSPGLPRNALAGFLRHEGSGEHRYIVTEHGYVMVDKIGGGFSHGLPRAEMPLLVQPHDALWASPPCPPPLQSPARSRRPGGEA
ncbi:hypothetical protein ACWDG9_16280 [Streptomyces sp. NPDC001073]